MAEKVERTPSARRRTSVGAEAATVVRELIGEVISDGFGSSGSGTKLSLAVRAQRAVLDKGPRLRKASLQDVTAQAVQWMHEGVSWRSFLVWIISAIIATGLNAYTTLLTSATANAAVFGMLMSVAAVGAFMALFFTSLTVIYSVTLAVTNFATGTVLFLSMCAALIVAVAREFWEGLIKIFELAMSAIAMIGSALATISAAGKTQIITVQKHPPH